MIPVVLVLLYFTVLSSSTGISVVAAYLIICFVWKLCYRRQGLRLVLCCLKSYCLLVAWCLDYGNHGVVITLLDIEWMFD